jgi:hypothetical protein
MTGFARYFRAALLTAGPFGSILRGAVTTTDEAIR